MRSKIDYGIYLGTTHCQLARMENGIPIIIRTDCFKDSMPLCVSINRRQEILIGDAAWNVHKSDKIRDLEIIENGKTNTFVGFTRTLGTSLVYECSNANKSFSSEELLAKCFEKMKLFITDEEVNSFVITIPDKFLKPQKEAVVVASKMAGIKQVEVIWESIATSFGYGQHNRTLIIFVFDKSEFKVSLIKNNTICDTEEDNSIGSIGLEEAIIDQIIIPYLQKNYAINSFLENSFKIEILRNAVRFLAEEAKNQLSFKDSYNILSDLGDLPFEDESGNELEIDIEITEQEWESISRPIYQRAIENTLYLLKRNNLHGKEIEKICLVGAETMSVLLRRMLKEQITEKVDTTVDPMTVVAKGAALFASTITVSDEVKEITRDKTKLQLDIKYESTTCELDSMLNLKVLKEKTTGKFPSKIFAEIVRSDGTWSSGKKLLSTEKVTLIDGIQLFEKMSNSFEIFAYDDHGNKLDCQPHQFNIFQGVDGLVQMQVLPYHIGIGKYFQLDEKDLFLPVKGLEKNKSLPAIGVINGFKSPINLRPGIESDVIHFPIYQGDYNADGKEIALSNHICDLIICGKNLPALLPKGSDINITIRVDTSQLMKISIYFPCLNHTEELQIMIKMQSSITTKDIDNIKSKLILFYSDNPGMGKDRFVLLIKELSRIDNENIWQDEKFMVLNTVKKEILKWS